MYIQFWCIQTSTSSHEINTNYFYHDTNSTNNNIDRHLVYNVIKGVPFVT